MRGQWLALESVTPRRHGEVAWIWLVKVAEVKRASVGMAPGVAANISTAHRLVFLEDMVLTTPEFLMTTMV